MITDKERVDWLDNHRCFNHDSDNNNHWIVAWLTQGEPGNINGPSGKFSVICPAFRDCIDKFISGEVTRID